jgi:hypothetical protein
VLRQVFAIKLRSLSGAAAVAACAAATLAAPGASADATVETDRDCYLEARDTTVQVRGAGFTPGLAFDVELDGETLPGGASSIAADGTMSGSFRPPELADDVVQRRFRLGLRTSEGTPATTFTVTRLRASFWPTAGPAATMRVRFSLFGFALGGPANQAYVHYVSPRGRLRKTVALGRPRGQCGAIPKTGKRRLFPFTASAGRWRLQFDTRRRYARGTAESSFLYYAISVNVKRPG